MNKEEIMKNFEVNLVCDNPIKIPKLSFKEYLNRALLTIPFWSATVKYFKRVYHLQN